MFWACTSYYIRFFLVFLPLVTYAATHQDEPTTPDFLRRANTAQLAKPVLEAWSSHPNRSHFYHIQRVINEFQDTLPYETIWGISQLGARYIREIQTGMGTGDPSETPGCTFDELIRFLQHMAEIERSFARISISPRAEISHFGVTRLLTLVPQAPFDYQLTYLTAWSHAFPANNFREQEADWVIAWTNQFARPHHTHEQYITIMDIVQEFVWANGTMGPNKLDWLLQQSSMVEDDDVVSFLRTELGLKEEAAPHSFSSERVVLPPDEEMMEEEEESYSSRSDNRSPPRFPEEEDRFLGSIEGERTPRNEESSPSHYSYPSDGEEEDGMLTAEFSPVEESDDSRAATPHGEEDGDSEAISDYRNGTTTEEETVTGYSPRQVDWSPISDVFNDTDSIS